MASKRQHDGMAWVRLYTDFPRHPKTLRLMSTAKGREAVGIYAFALTWSGDQLTDGYIPDYVLPALHATRAHTELLESVGLWERNGSGWHIHNWEKRQETAASLADSRQKKRKAACIKHHGATCGCWSGTPDE